VSNTFIGSEFMEILFSFPTWSCVKRCHTVPRPVPRPWQCGIWHHDQCLAPGNVSYGTTTSASPRAMWHMVPRPVPRPWQCVIRYHDQCLSPGIMSYGTTTSVFHMAMCHMGKRPVQPSNMLYGTTTSLFQCAMRYHDQCLSRGNVSCGITTSAT
jgi:hypothetical protein